MCFASANRSDRFWGALSHLFDVRRVLSTGVKRPGSEINHSFGLVPRLRMSGVECRWGRDFPHPSRHSQSRIQWIPGFFPVGEAAGAWS